MKLFGDYIKGIGVWNLKLRKELHKEIMYLKRKLIQIGNEKGLNHHLTIKTSQELDRLINEYLKLTQFK